MFNFVSERDCQTHLSAWFNFSSFPAFWTTEKYVMGCVHFSKKMSELSSEGGGERENEHYAVCVHNGSEEWKSPFQHPPPCTTKFLKKLFKIVFQKNDTCHANFHSSAFSSACGVLTHCDIAWRDMSPKQQAKGVTFYLFALPKSHIPPWGFTWSDNTFCYCYVTSWRSCHGRKVT